MKKNINQLSNLLLIEQSKLIKLCSIIESMGYLFNKSNDGKFEFSDKDIEIVLCFS